MRSGRSTKFSNNSISRAQLDGFFRVIPVPTDHFHLFFAEKWILMNLASMLIELASILPEMAMAVVEFGDGQPHKAPETFILRTYS